MTNRASFERLDLWLKEAIRFGSSAAGAGDDAKADAASAASPPDMSKLRGKRLVLAACKV